MPETFAASPFALSILNDRYAWKKSDGSHETWPEVAERVVDAVLGPIVMKCDQSSAPCFCGTHHDALCFCVDCLGSEELS